MNKAFEKMLAAKKAKSGEMPKKTMEARGSVLDDLMSNMDDRDSKKLGMNKVSVMAPDEEGLKKGLEKAKEVVGEMPEDEMMEDEDLDEEVEHEMAESSEQQMKEDETMEALQAQIEELKAKLAKLGV